MAPGDVDTRDNRDIQDAREARDLRVPDVGPAESDAEAVVPGPFNSRQLFRIDEALTAADRETGLTFSVYCGELAEPIRETAEALHDQLPSPLDSVLIAVSPNQRVLEIVTGRRASKRLPDRACELAGMSMRAAFAGGDLAGGIITGLRMLADRARVG